MTKHTHNGVEYFLTDPSPHVLFLSGMHGNEYESGILLEQFLKTAPYAYLYVPTVSPSAIAAKKRKNAFGNDINRMFFPNTSDREAQNLMHVLASRTFRLCIDVHEDPDRTGSFYVYDTEIMNPEQLQNYRDSVRSTGIRLYTGVDDEEDEKLGLLVKQGYISTAFEQHGTYSGFFSRWAFEQDVAKRIFTLEIPGKAPITRKEQLIKTVVPFLYHSFGVE